MAKTTWPQKVGVYFLWILVCALGAWVFVMVRHALSNGMDVFYIRKIITHSWRAGAWDRLYIVVAGLGYLVYIFVVQWYLDDGLATHTLLRRAARVAGIELLIIFFSDLFTQLIRQAFFNQIGPILLVAELLVGGGLLFYSLRTKTVSR
ncbi:MAG: hypothetical protein JXA21_17495 [Anaerolineae bacterium]|nr:hypothetical protein [Anaerolineae bacterium]